MTTTIPYQNARLMSLLGEANNLLIEEGLYGQGWKIVFDQAKSRAGNCNYVHKRITLSAPFARINSDEEVRDTFRHEIAHALAGRDAGHGPVWKAHAIRLGARPSYRASENSVAPQGRYRASCERCSEVLGTRHKRTKTMTQRRWTHKGCGGGLLWTDTVTGRLVN
jgi:predicted SprT family Zn-dependent metalloprotease